MASETEIETAKRRLSEADERYARQYALVKELSEKGRDTTEAEEFLAQYRIALQDVREHLLHLEAGG